MFKKTQSARKWLAKYSGKELQDLPSDLRRKINYFKAAQAVTIIALVIGLFSFTVWMVGLGILGVGMLLFMRKGFEPALDRAIASHQHMAEVLSGTGAMAKLSPLEQAKATYLALPEGDPRIELALQKYKAELAKGKTGAARVVQNAENAENVPAVPTPKKPAPVAVTETKSALELEIALKMAEAKYLALKDGDPQMARALKEYVDAKKNLEDSRK